MSYSSYDRNEFSFVSVYRIRHCLAMNSYYADTDRTQLVKNPDNVNGYTNFPYAIQTDNHAPVLDTDNLHHSYTIPKGSLFQFDLKATDADGDELKYNALQADVYAPNDGFSTYNAKLAYEDETTASCVKFDPKWEYDYTQWSKKDYTDARTLPVGTYRIWLQVNDGKDDATHGVGYAAYETKVNVVDGTAFEMTGSYASAYKAGERVTLTWNVDTDVFGSDSRVRILLSDDFGTTWKYVLNPNAPNSGSAEVILPQTAFDKVYFGNSSYNKQVRAGVIKVEVIDNVAYAVTALDPVDSTGKTMTGGFTLNASAITFKGTPERYVEVENLTELPEKADVKAYDGATELPVTYTETNNGYYVQRVWETELNGTKSAFEQILVRKEGSTPTSIAEVNTASPASDDAIYDLLGRRVSSPTPGRIYIRNGRKFRN
jgi:hypothetical protein